MARRKCAKCGRKKDEKKFNRKGDGLNSYCKECNRIVSKEHYKKHRKKYIQRSKDRRTEIAIWLRGLRVSIGCISCGETHPACLDFHHKNGDEKSVSIASARVRYWSKKRILKEVEKCEVLCSNCHRKFHDSPVA